MQRLSGIHLSCGLIGMFFRAGSLLLVSGWICNQQNQDIDTAMITLHDLSRELQVCSKAALCGVLTSGVVSRLVKRQLNGFIQQRLQVYLLLLSFTLCFLLSVQGAGHFCWNRQRRIVLTRCAPPFWHFHAYNCALARRARCPCSMLRSARQAA